MMHQLFNIKNRYYAYVCLLLSVFTFNIQAMSDDQFDVIRDEGDQFEELINPLTEKTSPDSQFDYIQECDQFEELVITRSLPAVKTTKKWNIILFVAADNDLDPFARRNIKQLVNVGSTKNINILVHLDIRNNNQKMTRWYYVEKNNLVLLNGDDPSTQRMDSGDPHSLISWITFALENFPAEHNALIFWNHGSGTIDPGASRTINISEFFVFNPESEKYDLDRSIGYLDLLNDRGLCWDDTTGNFLTNQKLEYALNTCCQGPLKGKLFDVIGFDACLMGMTEVAEIIKRYAHIMVASEEVELGTGWHYERILSSLINSNTDFDALDLARTIVQNYNKTYAPITNDYTLSALDLSLMSAIEKNIDTVAKLLVECLKKQKNNSVKQILKWCRNGKNCTHFDEPRYLDLHHLYGNILTSLDKFMLTDSTIARDLRHKLQQALTEGKQLIEQVVIINCTGKNLQRARGLAIYWPEDRIHNSYRYTNFAKTNAWYQMIGTYLMA